MNALPFAGYKKRLTVTFKKIVFPYALRFASCARQLVKEHTPAVSIACATLIIFCGCRMLIPGDSGVLRIDYVPPCVSAHFILH